MLTFEQIQSLIELVAEHRMAGIEIERAGFRLKVDGYLPADTYISPAPAMPQEAAAPVTAPAPTPPAAAPVANEASADSGAADADEDLHWVNSPIVGTFYRAANPEAESFVKVGGRVEVGQTLCIVEAMKLMNEIESDAAGEVVKVKPQNGQGIEFGEPLFGIRVG